MLLYQSTHIKIFQSTGIDFKLLSSAINGNFSFFLVENSDFRPKILEVATVEMFDNTALKRKSFKHGAREQYLK